MLSLFKPRPDAIRAFLAAQQDRRFSYEHVGASRATAPNGYVVDHNRVQLGLGRPTFERGRDAVKQWKMFDITWLELCWPNVPIETGATVAVAVQHLGFWSLNACRIVYTIEESGPIEKFGFAYGTLPDHAAKGEERFTVEFHSDDQTVWYDVYAFSRPRPFARLAYPYTRALQKRFASDSKRAMQKAVEQS
ncbi:MAG: DUF1990 domain-containing protein [Candidatus Acidiferrales bacterium]